MVPALRHHRRVIAAVAAACLGLGVLAPVAGAVAGDEGDPVADALARPGALDSLGDVARLADATEGDPGAVVGVVTDRNGTAPGGIGVERIVVDGADLTALVDRLGRVDGVFSAAPDVPVALTSDPRDAEQYGPTRIGARALAPGRDGTGVTVAVVDTGVRASHPDLAPTLPDGRPRIATGTSFLLFDPANGSAGTSDPNGHGTHVAGIITAARGNGQGGSGVAPGAQVLPVRVLNSWGLGWSVDVTAGILWAHQQGADVINLSLGAPGSTPPEMDAAITYVTTDRSRGKAPTVVVAAAGNSGPGSGPTWPGSHPRAIAVAATDANDTVAPFSSWGSWVDVAAPGSGILSTCSNGDYCSMSGTSMATPMVAGAAAVLRQQDPGRGADEVRARLESTAVDLGSPGRDAAYGAGRIDLVAATGAGSAPTGPSAPVPVSGAVDHAVTDRRRLIVGGTAFDPDGAPLVRVISLGNGQFGVHDAVATGGRWEASWEDRPGTYTVCAAGVDQPTNDAVLLGCRQLLVK